MKNSARIFFCLLLAACTSKQHRQESAPADHNMQADEIMLSDLQVQLGNIHTDTVREQKLYETFDFSGRVVFDEKKTTTLSSRVMGRIETLYFRKSGDRIKKGDILYEIYSEELNLAMNEYRLLLDKAQKFPQGPTDLDALLSKAQHKLSLLGLSESQIIALKNKDAVNPTVKILSPSDGLIVSVDVNEGNYVMEGQSIFHLSDLSHLWIEALVFPMENLKIEEGMSCTVTFPQLPGETRKSTILFLEPQYMNGRSYMARVEVTNNDKLLRPGMSAEVSVRTNAFTALAVPNNSLLYGSKGATVWVQTGKNMFSARMVHAGAESDEFTEIMHGLKTGDIVVTSGAYLINSEYIFKKGANPMAGHDMSNM